ncbi:MAG: carboxynorspermidine decarboxylase [Alkalispirochaeta sp.]
MAESGERPGPPPAAHPRHDPRPYNPDGRPFFAGFDPASVPSPCFVVDIAAVEHNLRILRETADRAGATVLLALKAFALPAVFGLVRRYLDGVCASGPYEAHLGRAEVRGSVHTYGPAYSAADLETILSITDHLSFNSLAQWARLRDRCLAAQHTRRNLQFGLRINPEFSLGNTPLYDPCAPYSRLGTTIEQLRRDTAEHTGVWEGLSGLHFHTLCENDSYALEHTLDAVEERFGDILRRPEITWLNLGGGHHITKPDYDRDHLVRILTAIKERYDVEVILEPGEAAAIHTGILVASVLDLPVNGMNLAILNTSATAHMPDTLEMPYRPDVWGSSLPGGAAHLYRLGGGTCLAGDVIGDYAFADPLAVGDRLVFDDMSHYTMVKTTTFNGIPLPAIATWDSVSRSGTVLRESSYEDFRARLGSARKEVNHGS